MKPVLIVLTMGLAALTGCASPYEQALENPVVQRPEPPLTAADMRALAPYEHSPYFRDR